MIRHSTALATLCFTLAVTSAAQGSNLPPSPRSIALPVVGQVSPEPEITGPPPFGGSGRVVRNVSQPRLEVFAPAPGKSTGAAMIIAPGGGFQFLSIDNEGEALARWLADRGVTAIVLRYRTVRSPADQTQFKQQVIKLFQTGGLRPGGLDALGQPGGEDGRAAVRTVRARAASLGVDPSRVGFIGFSAGAWVALSTAAAADASERPNLLAAIYPVRPASFQPPADAPPLFLAAAADDPLLKVEGQIDLYQLWRAGRRPAELHLYPRGGHGFGMSPQGTASDRWIDAFAAWLQGYSWLSARP
ncbi:MAG TPA: alpha/beta hydrolase [Caulobacter sp.]|nr:alpha/beta hydrolase [Caulobacter sp.]